MASLDSTPIASLLMLPHTEPSYNTLKRSLTAYGSAMDDQDQGQPLFLVNHQTSSDPLGNLSHVHHLPSGLGLEHTLNLSSSKHNHKRRRSSSEALDLEHRRPPSPLDALVMALEGTDNSVILSPPLKNSRPDIVSNAELEFDHNSSSIMYNLARRNSASSNDDKRIYICELDGCEKQFIQLAHLRIHQRSHTGQRPYVCQFPGCDKAFTQLGNLKTHERKHTGERPYRCSHLSCGKTFTQLGNLKTHERIHSAVKPFFCIVEGCGKGFSQLGNLKTHQQKMHPDHPQPLNGLRQSSRKTVPQSQGVQDEFLATGYQRTSSAREVQLLSKIKGLVARQTGGRRKPDGAAGVRWSETDGSEGEDAMMELADVMEQG